MKRWQFPPTTAKAKSVVSVNFRTVTWRTRSSWSRTVRWTIGRPPFSSRYGPEHLPSVHYLYRVENLKYSRGEFSLSATRNSVTCLGPAPAGFNKWNINELLKRVGIYSGFKGWSFFRLGTHLEHFSDVLSQFLTFQFFKHTFFQTFLWKFSHPLNKCPGQFPGRKMQLILMFWPKKEFWMEVYDFMVLEN